MNSFPEDPHNRIWYGPGRIRENTLGTFVSNLTQKLGLSEEKVLQPLSQGYWN